MTVPGNLAIPYHIGFRPYPAPVGIQSRRGRCITLDGAYHPCGYLVHIPYMGFLAHTAKENQITDLRGIAPPTGCPELPCQQRSIILDIAAQGVLCPLQTKGLNHQPRYKGRTPRCREVHMRGKAV